MGFNAAKTKKRSSFFLSCKFNISFWLACNICAIWGEGYNAILPLTYTTYTTQARETHHLLSIFPLCLQLLTPLLYLHIACFDKLWSACCAMEELNLILSHCVLVSITCYLYITNIAMLDGTHLHIEIIARERIPSGFYMEVSAFKCRVFSRKNLEQSFTTRKINQC